MLNARSIQTRAAGLAPLTPDSSCRTRQAVRRSAGVDVSDATVVTLYLLAASNAKLRPLITARLRPGARIVAHNYPVGGGWEPEVVDNFTDRAGTMRTLYLWTADGKVH